MNVKIFWNGYISFETRNNEIKGREFLFRPCNFQWQIIIKYLLPTRAFQNALVVAFELGGIFYNISHHSTVPLVHSDHEPRAYAFFR